MSQFLETIKINNGRRINLSGHNKRMNFTRNRHFHEIRDLDLSTLIQVPYEYRKGIVKCRVVYGRKVDKVEFELYQYQQPKSFQLVYDDTIDYAFKASDRSALKSLFDQRSGADDIIIVKDGFVTDSYYANLAFNKNGLWYTPKSPLLLGTQRAKLIEQGKLIEMHITVNDVRSFEYFKIFNAMTEWGMCEPIKANRIEL